MSCKSYYMFHSVANEYSPARRTELNYTIMIKLFYHEVSNKIRSLLLVSSILITGYANGQQSTTILPNNASYSNKVAPQGALRYQRGFYLVTPAEMNASGITSGMNINSIGFTIGRAQNDTTKGQFKLYLQNTSDLVSRADTGWNSVTATTNEYYASSLFPGRYEWQVKANCSVGSTFTSSVFFANDELGGCNNPYNLNTVTIAPTTATLSWETSSSPVFTNYRVEYTALDVVNWISTTTVDTFLNVTGLTAGKQYQWRVKTLCSADSSAVNYATFTSGVTTACTALTGLSALISGDTARLAWTAGTSATFYEIQFRRTGTEAWSNTISTTNTSTLILLPGTSYEWQVRMACAGGKSAYTSSVLTTGGTAVCYAPANPTTRSITGSSAKLTWATVVGATSYTIRYRLKNTISWTNAISGTPAMTLACDSLISIPDTTGGYNIPFHGGSTFTYNGSGVYIAWEYSRPSGALSSANLMLSTTAGTSVPGVNGQDSLRFLLSMASRPDAGLTELPGILAENQNRPETRFGSSSLKDSVAVIAVYALGNTIPRFQSPTPISALIANHAATSKTYTVTLRVIAQSSGVVRDSTTTDITISANDTSSVVFSSWSPSISETDSIIISVPAQANENVVNNNSKAYLQKVNGRTIGYDDGSVMVAEVGAGPAGGMLLTKHTMRSCGKVIAAKVYLTESAKGKSIKAVVLNASGVVKTESSSFIPATADVNTYHTFYFDSSASFTNEDFYIGIKQPLTVTPFTPVGAQWEDAVPRAGAYYRGSLDGTSLVDSPQLGRLMILAEVISSAPEVFISGNLILCTGASNTLTASSQQTRFANAVIDVSTQNSNTAVKILGSPDVYPSYGLNTSSWITASADGRREFIELSFPDSAAINYVDIYETANPGAVDSIFVKNTSTNTYNLVYSATAATKPAVARKNRISFPLTSFNVSQIRIALNSPLVTGYNAIDAVGIGQTAVPGTFSTYLWSPGGETTATKSVSASGTYKVTVTNAGGCSSTDSVVVVTTASTLPVITGSSATPLCAGDSITLTSSQATGIKWSNGATTQSVTVHASGSYTVKYNSGSGCDSLTSAAYVVTINPLPVASISGSGDICLGNSNTLTAGAGFTSYLWNTGETNQSISVGAASIYSVLVTNSNGCRDTASLTTRFVTLAAPVVTGNLSFCPGGSTTLDAGAVYSTYLWSTGASTKTISVYTAGDVTVTVTNANGCTASKTVNISIYTSPVPQINGNDGFCAGGSTTLNATLGFVSYLWSNNAVTASTTVSNIGTYTVTVTDNNGCTGSKAQVVSVYPNPVPVISGTLSFCGGTNTTLNAGSGYLAYLWSTGATTQSVNVSTAGVVSVTVTNTNGCTASATATTTLTGSIPAVPGAIAGATNASCGTTGNLYSITAVPNTSHYVWTVPTGATIVSGQGTTSITVNYGASFQGGYIRVAASNACGQSPSLTPRQLFVQSLANVPGAITGLKAPICAPSTQTYSITAVNGATSYTWSVPAGSSIVSGQGTRTISVSFVAGFSTGNICVTANNACGSSASSCAILSGIPPAPATINGASNVCINAQNMNYSVEPVAGATSYTWTLPQSANISLGDGTTNIIVNFGPNSGNITVKANSACGSSAVVVKPVTLISCTSGFVSNVFTMTEIRPVPEVVASYGGYAKGRKIDLEWTVGEPMVQTERANNILYAQGFHQPVIHIAIPEKESDLDALLIKVYPNPVSSLLTVQFETAGNKRLTLEVQDMQGRILQTTTVYSADKAQELNFRSYAIGSYFLVVKNDKGKIVNTTRLVKIIH